MEFDHKKTFCPILDVDGVISEGKQFDLDITLPEDNRDVIYGVVKNCFKEPVRDAVVKLVEVVCEHGKEERRPIGHTFTDKEGEFVFGPLCPGKEYAIQIWVNDTKNFKICVKCHHEGKCLKGEKHDKCDCFMDKKDDKYEEYDKECKCKKHEEHDKECKCERDREHDKECKCEKDREHDKECKCEKDREHDKECKCEKDREHDKECKCERDREHDKECKCEKDREHDKDCKDDKYEKEDKECKFSKYENYGRYNKYYKY